jgi:hypothetical protein
MFCVFDVNVCDTLMFDEVVQDVYRYMNMCVSCVETRVKRQLKRTTRPDNPGRIFAKYPGPNFWLRTRGIVAQYRGRNFGRTFGRKFHRAGLSGPDFLEISGPPRND